MYFCGHACVCFCGHACVCFCGHACVFLWACMCVFLWACVWGGAEADLQYDPVKEGTSSYSVMLEHGGMVDGLVAVSGWTGGSQ